VHVSQHGGSAISIFAAAQYETKKHIYTDILKQRQGISRHFLCHRRCDDVGRLTASTLTAIG